MKWFLLPITGRRNRCRAHGDYLDDALKPWMTDIPAAATIRGMFFQPLLAVAPNAGKRRYLDFLRYPASEWVEVALAAAEQAHPELHWKEGVRKLGRGAFPTFASSPIGRTVLGAFASDLEGVLKLAPRAYKHTGTFVSAKLISLEPGNARIGLRGCWDLAPWHQVGVYDGVLAHFGKEGDVVAHVHTPCDVDIELTWR